MRDPGLQQVIRTAGGVRGLSRLLGISQPAVSNWTRVPADRILQVESLTGVPRFLMRPDLYGGTAMEQALDPIEQARAEEYALLGVLLQAAPGMDLLSGLSRLKGDTSPLGAAHSQLGMAASDTKAQEIEDEFFRLFIGLGRGELMPYASYYLTGFLHDRPLAKVRADLARLGIERAAHISEPEDHIAVLCEVMSGIVSGRFADETVDPRRFFDRHLKPWADRFFADLQAASTTAFYQAVGTVGRVFIEIEKEANTLPG
jgi:TorA maturation chaperone TorD